MTRENGRHAAGRRTPPAAPPVPGPRREQHPADERPADERPAVPRLTDGLQFHGKYHGSGFARPMFTVRRIDGQVVQLSQLLYHLACAIDGVRDSEQVAARVSATFAREISAPDVEFLIEDKLRPVGVVTPLGAAADAGLDPEAPRSDLLLVLKGRRTLLGPAAVGRIARALAWLHYPPLVGLVLAGAVAMDVWLFYVHGAVSALLGVLDRPALLLAVFALAVASLLFHEFGHASACHYGGARPGRIGCGIYLLWPSLFTDVTDVYRITRPGRLRTDLGGVYFNVVFMLAMTGLYGLTGQPFLLAAVYLGHFEVLEQLVPVVRLDGYYILSDLVGVPDLFGQVGPILRRALPGRGKAGRSTGAEQLTGRSRALVTGWAVTVVPVIAAEILYMLWHLPVLVATGLRSLSAQATEVSYDAAHADPLGCAAAVLGFLLLALPLAATGYLLLRLARMLAGVLRRRLGPALGLGPDGRAGAALLRARGAVTGRVSAGGAFTGAGRRAVLALAVLGIATGLGSWLVQEDAGQGPSAPSGPVQAPPTLSLLGAPPTPGQAPVSGSRPAVPAALASSSPATKPPATPTAPAPTSRVGTRPPSSAAPTAPATPSAAPTVSRTPSAPPTSPDPTASEPGRGHRSPPASRFPRDPGHGGR